MCAMLLLDLDGVVVLELRSPHLAKLEIIVLHDLQDEGLKALGVPIVVLTHRSRAEAKRILAAAGLTMGVITGVLAAEDILQAALLSGRPWSLLRHGLKKSWVLSILEKRYGIARDQVAFIDDRRDNLEDMLSHGLGLALHAPSGISADGATITSFDFEHAGNLMKAWGGTRRVTEIQPLQPREIHSALWVRTGLNTRREALSAFNTARLFGRGVRRIRYSR